MYSHDPTFINKTGVTGGKIMFSLLSFIYFFFPSPCLFCSGGVANHSWILMARQTKVTENSRKSNCTSHTGKQKKIDGSKPAWSDSEKELNLKFFNHQLLCWTIHKAPLWQMMPKRTCKWNQLPLLSHLMMRIMQISLGKNSVVDGPEWQGQKKINPY